MTETCLLLIRYPQDVMMEQNEYVQSLRRGLIWREYKREIQFRKGHPLGRQKEGERTNSQASISLKQRGTHYQVP